MEEQIWAVRPAWPKVTGGVNCRGQHNPADSHSGLNISYHVGDDPQRVDLPELNRLTLLDCGLREAAIEKSELCTICGEVPFFSYRASGPNRGLQGAFIAITKD